MNYGLITIGTGVNLGNRLIEYALLRVLGLPEPAHKASMFRPLTDRDVEVFNSCDFVLLPGATILADGPGQSEALRSLHRLSLPIYCTAASGWAPRIPYHGREVLERLTPPIGARDPHTLRQLDSLGIPAMLVGCPTAYLPPLQKKPTHVVFGFGREQTDWQKEAMTRWRERAGLPCVAAVQEPAFGGRLADGMNMPWFAYDDMWRVYQQFSAAKQVITGRLHGLLPAMSQRRPVAFFGDEEDSRFTLVKHLGITMTPYGAPFEVQPPESYEPALQRLNDTFRQWGQATVEALGP